MWPSVAPPGSKPPIGSSPNALRTSSRTVAARAVRPASSRSSDSAATSARVTQENRPPVVSPVRADARARASASWSAYASGKADRWTAWAASVIGIVS